MYTLSNNSYAGTQSISGFTQFEFQSLASEQSLNLYTSWLKSIGFSDTTIKTYRSWVKKFLTNCSSNSSSYSGLTRDMQMHKLLLEFKTRMINEAACAPHSTNNAVSAIDSYCRYLQIDLPTVKREPSPVNDYPVLTREELETVLGVLESVRFSTRDRAIVLLFLQVGMSLKNCRELNMQDVSMTSLEGQILIEYGPSRQRKTARVDRRSALGLALTMWTVERVGMTQSEQTAFFVSNTGQRLSASSLDIITRKVGWKARVPLSIRLLRDTGTYMRRLNMQVR